MKKLMIIMLFVSCGTLFAQKTTTKTSSKTSSHSTTKGKTNVSISVNEEDDSYSFSSKFNQRYWSEINNLLVSELGKPTQKNTKMITWKGIGYSVILRPNRLLMEMDKESTRKSNQKIITSLGDEVSIILGGTPPPTPPTPPARN